VPNERDSAGFTLLEIIVALVILGLAAAALMPGISTSLKLTTRSAGEREAILFAESKLAEIGAGRLEPGMRSGVAPGGLAWRADISADATTPSLARFSVLLTVQPSAGPAVHLATMLLGPPL